MNEKGVTSMFLDKKPLLFNSDRYQKVYDMVAVRKNEVCDVIDVMFARGDVSDESATYLSVEIVEELRDYVSMIFKDDREDRALEFFESIFEGASEDVLTYVRETRKVLVGGMGCVRALEPVEDRDVYIVLVFGESNGYDAWSRETKFSERAFITALPELRRLVSSIGNRNSGIDLDEFSRVGLPCDEDGYVVDEVLEVKIMYVDKNGVLNQVTLV